MSFDQLMYPCREWNQMGPAVPIWFRRRLAAFDPELVLQFLAPVEANQVTKTCGVDKRMYPQGAWVVARRMRRSKMLLKQFVYWITGEYDPAKKQEHDWHGILRVLREARNLHRNGSVARMEEDIDRFCVASTAETAQRSRTENTHRLAAALRAYGISRRSLGRTMISNHGTAHHN